MKRNDLKLGAVARARSLRQSSTSQERILWQTLRRYSTHAKFRRQAPIGAYFVDFVSHSAKLIVELDGAQHTLQREYDDERTRFLRQEGYRVLRFWNRDIDENLEGVFAMIEAELKKSPSPLVGEGGAERRMRGQPEAPLTPCPLPQGEREILAKSSISEF